MGYLRPLLAGLALLFAAKEAHAAAKTATVQTSCYTQTFGGTSGAGQAKGAPCITGSWKPDGTTAVTGCTNAAVDTAKNLAANTDRKGPWCATDTRACKTSTTPPKWDGCTWGYCEVFTDDNFTPCVWGVQTPGTTGSTITYIYQCQPMQPPSQTEFWCPTDATFSLANVGKCVLASAPTPTGTPTAAKCSPGCAGGGQNCPTSVTCSAPTTAGSLCVFPFKYNSKKWSNCISDIRGKNWCGTSADVDKDNQIATCAPNAAITCTPDPTTGCVVNTVDRLTPGQTTFVGVGGRTCIFPFTYKSGTQTTAVSYDHCVNLDVTSGKWCGVQAAVTTGPSSTTTAGTEWGYCVEATMQCPAKAGCVRPTTTGGFCSRNSFDYLNKKLVGCITDTTVHPDAASGLPFCMLEGQTTIDPNNRNTWGYCAAADVCNGDDPNSTPTCTVHQNRAGVTSGLCVFPFIFEGKLYHTCTKAGGYNIAWCSTVTDYDLLSTADKENAWGECILPTHGGTAAGGVCHFPFLFDNREYYACTTDGTHAQGKTWCATTASYDTDKRWGECAVNYCLTDDQLKPTCPVRTEGLQTTDTLNTCIFPFTFGGKTYTTCTTADNAKVPWCSISNNPATIRGNCIRKTFDGTSTNNEKCAFPFMYEGSLRTDCISTKDRIQPWCATVSDYSADVNNKAKHKWGYCVHQYCQKPHEITPKCDVMTRDGNANGAKCKFPFKNGRHTHIRCITEGYPDGRVPQDQIVPWCSTTDDFHRDGKWGKCILPSGGGNSGTNPCHFPFLYNGKYYTQCTTDDSATIVGVANVNWCSTTSSYDNDKKWGYCSKDYCPLPKPEVPPCKVKTFGGTAPAGSECTFPFIKDDNPVYSCITEDYPGDTSQPGTGVMAWCCTSAQYIKGVSPWGNCQVPTTGGTGGGAPCRLPFSIGGVFRYSCITNQPEISTAPWCSTTLSYDYDKKFGVCGTNFCPPLSQKAPACTVRSNKGDCVFPFIFRGINVYTCKTSDIPGDPNSKRPWCATSSNFDANPNSWGLCNVPTLEGTAGGANCYFPFRYQGAFHSNCIQDTGGRYWCSAEANYVNPTASKWGYCSPDYCPLVPTTKPNCTVFATKSDGTVKPCVFPFTMQHKTINSCIKEGHPDPTKVQYWCSLTSDFDANPNEWGNCIIPTNSTNEPCVIPFYYDNRWNFECLTDRQTGRKWCSLDTNYVTSRRLGYCGSNFCPAQNIGRPNCTVMAQMNGTTGTTAPSRNACVFPFTFRGRTYQTCATDQYPIMNARIIPWCSFTAVLPVAPAPSQWGNCRIGTMGGTGNNSVCRLPFKFNNIDYYGCVSNLGGRKDPWCFIDAANTKWGYCAVNYCIQNTIHNTTRGPGCYIPAVGAQTLGFGDRCVFPFQYQGNMFNNCISSPAFPIPWCSKTANYDRDRAWGSCGNVTCPPNVTTVCYITTTGGNAGGRNCSMSFTVNGKTYKEQCVLPTPPARTRPWCSTTANYATDQQWGYCDLFRCVNITAPTGCYTPALVVGTVNVTRPCVFPFWYNGTMYSGCTSDAVWTVKWCSLRTNYSDGNLWGYCMPPVGCNYTSTTTRATTQSALTSDLPRSTPTFALRCQWQTNRGRGGHNGVRLIQTGKTTFTEDECQLYCDNRRDCYAIDYNSGDMCFTHTSATFGVEPYNNPQVIQMYKTNTPCP